LPQEQDVVDSRVNFLKSGNFFKRYIIDKEIYNCQKFENISPVDGIELYNGNCLDVLASFESNIFDGSVTSPPYYNAKSYTQWPNIYCYLYDMYNIHKHVFRVLKPGALYLFNIFDYFDNENITVFSDMGKKRLILGSYLLHIFRQVGFETIGNIVWFKGDIQGNRAFNQGNNSPYYQTPLNAYEHIFVLGKPDVKNYRLPRILAKMPVIKMIKGRNVIGHEAPYPESIPNLLFEIMGKEAKYVLDPFAGTLTTSKVALKKGARSVAIEMSKEYCNLAISNLRMSGNQFLF
jgi:DNA modification methylase